MSEELKCTQGPWRIGYTRAFDAEGEYNHTLNIVIGDRIIPLTSAGVGNCPDDYDEWEANARLITAAPDLLEALEAVVKAWLHEAGQGDGIMEEHAPILAKARAVIAEVKGEATIWHDLPIATLETETTGTEEGARIVEAQGRLAKNGGKQ